MKEPTLFKAQEDIEPPYDELSRCPNVLNKTRTIDDVLYVAARAPKDVQPEILFVGTSIQEEEAATEIAYTQGVRLRQKPEYLKGATGMIIDVAGRAGIDMEKQAYTCLVKWLLPRAQRNRPPKKVLNWGMPMLENEIEKFRPKIIVCMGKPAFDQLADIKIKFDDATGGWFWSERYQAHLYVMQPPYMLVTKPDLYEVFRIDFQEVARKLELLRNGEQTAEEVTWEVIDDVERLEEWVESLPATYLKIVTVDCEWHGDTHVDGQLRMIQFGVSETHAVIVRFMDDALNYTFEGADYRKVGKILGRYMNLPDVKYVGHHWPADAPWMHHVLGLEVIGKCILDTEFAQQTVDEASELGLERGISMRYTTLGRYDLDLTLWKKENKALCEGGYGYIPDSILLPYAAKDVCAPYRAYPQIRKLLEFQGLLDYYDRIFNPFVTDVFTQFAITGLPVDLDLMKELQEVYHFVRRRLDKEFKIKSVEFARKLMIRHALETRMPMPTVVKAIQMVQQGKIDEARNEIKGHAEMKTISRWNILIDYLVAAPDFNTNSPDQMRLWLFDACQLTPIKSTNQKAKGLPSMSWEKVMELPPDRQALYTPAMDKQTIMILRPECPLIDDLLDLKVVGNLCKAFLKESEEFLNDDGEIEVVRKGLLQWVASDVRIHCQYSTTETGRPRTWRPNSLNWPSYVTSRIATTILKALRAGEEDPEFPEVARKYLGYKSEKDMMSIRSIVTAPPGQCLVESDYATAEMVALAMIAHDKELQRLLFDPDPEWALLKKDPVRNPQEIKMVRVAWSDPKVTGIVKAQQQSKYLLAAWDADKRIAQFTEDDLLRDADGNVVHAKYDIHWSLVEMSYGKPRERMQAKVERQSGKVANFRSSYGGGGASMETQIYADTGVKPEEGTGDRLLDAIHKRQPRATEFLEEEMARLPQGKKYYRAASGRLRRCVTHGRDSGVNWRLRNSIESALGREMRNFP